MNSQEWTLARSVPDVKLVGISHSTELRLVCITSIRHPVILLVHTPRKYAYLTGVRRYNVSEREREREREREIHRYTYIYYIYLTMWLVGGSLRYLPWLAIH